MKIESIAYSEEYISPEDPTVVTVVDTYLIKENGEIFRKLNGESKTYNKATRGDFNILEKEVLDFIDKADNTVYFIDDLKVSIIILYANGTKQIVERGLSHDDEFFASIIEDYLDEFAE